MVFDTAQGTVTIGGKRLAGNVSPQHVRSIGFVFEREIDMNTGWIFRNTRKDDFAGHEVVPALGFRADQLKRVSVTFLEADASGCPDLSQRHRSFLAQELGAATKETAVQVCYEYPWGEISAEDDARNVTSYIIVTWL